jgi:hypothetical protein
LNFKVEPAFVDYIIFCGNDGAPREVPRLGLKCSRIRGSTQRPHAVQSLQGQYPASACSAGSHRRRETAAHRSMKIPSAYLCVRSSMHSPKTLFRSSQPVWCWTKGLAQAQTLSIRFGRTASVGPLVLRSRLFVRYASGNFLSFLHGRDCARVLWSRCYCGFLRREPF